MAWQQAIGSNPCLWLFQQQQPRAWLLRHGGDTATRWLLNLRLFRCREPFPAGDRVTFNGKECVCQKCSQPLPANSPAPIQAVHSQYSECCGAVRPALD